MEEETIKGEWYDCDLHPEYECYKFLNYLTDEFEYDCAEEVL